MKQGLNQGRNHDKKKEEFQREKYVEIISSIAKIICALCFLYLFIVSLGILSGGFQVLGGAKLNEVLHEYNS